MGFTSRSKSYVRVLPAGVRDGFKVLPAGFRIGLVFYQQVKELSLGITNRSKSWVRVLPAGVRVGLVFYQQE